MKVCFLRIWPLGTLCMGGVAGRGWDGLILPRENELSPWGGVVGRGWDRLILPRENEPSPWGGVVGR